MPPKKIPKHVAAKLLKNPAPPTGRNSSTISMYASCLSADHLGRYLDKISKIGNKDPYLLRMTTNDLPLTITYESIIDYALLKHSAYSGDRFKCFKALESKSRFENGMVQTVECVKIDQIHVVRGKVMHSMSLTEPSLTPWIIVEGSHVLSAHCDCIAGVGEVCSHVGAVLYHLTSLNHNELANKCVQASGFAVTDVEQQWGGPKKKITENLQQPLHEIDFGYHRDYHDAASGNVPTLEVDDIRVFLTDLQKIDIQCTAMQEFCCDNNTCFRCRENEIDPFYSSKGLLLNELYDVTFEQKSLEELRFIALSIYNRTTKQVNKETLLKVEADTRQQWKSNLWKLLRTGRITASMVKKVISTRIEKPSISLLKQICYPDTSYFSTQATRYGKKMEKVAFHELVAFLEKAHDKASLMDTGLLMDSEHPELAASPDGILRCACCGVVPIEIKCPFRFKDETDVIMKLTQKQHPYISQSTNGFEMVKNHEYYGQVQMQIALTKASYGYFYIWTKDDDLLIVVTKDEDYWEQTKLRAVNFYKAVVLPELLAKYFTNRVANAE